MTKSRYWRQDLVVPKTRKATSDAVTPGMKRTMSTIEPDTLKSGLPAAAMLALLFAWKSVNIMMVISNNLVWCQ
tara:strand:- start:312 stop:533 length:222 start_codon:yes stop_codon:yes gene_type:complete